MLGDIFLELIRGNVLNDSDAFIVENVEIEDDADIFVVSAREWGDDGLWIRVGKSRLLKDAFIRSQAVITFAGQAFESKNISSSLKRLVKILIVRKD